MAVKDMLGLPPQKNGTFSDTVRIMWATETGTNWSLGLFNHGTGQWLDAKTRSVFTEEVIGWEELPRNPREAAD